ncbi:hypothetical protein F4801DRAFT_572865 [Xylaria longipes]|nr:hypothetical protein F4801DRAFT_572865 [Xylaria longipes]
MHLGYNSSVGTAFHQFRTLLSCYMLVAAHAAFICPTCNPSSCSIVIKEQAKDHLNSLTVPRPRIRAKRHLSPMSHLSHCGE